MSTRSRIPPLLERYLQLPAELSLIFLTGTLGCSPHWLASLFVGNALAQRPDNADHPSDSKEYGIILASWMRDKNFWTSHIRRTTGIDALKLEQQHRLVFINCLRPDAALADSEKRIIAAITEITISEDRAAVLILDNPDVLLAIGATTAQQLALFTTHLRAAVHSTIVSCSADLPLVRCARPYSVERHALPIEVETAAFVSQTAHAADYILSVRELQTGAAKDVSGVLQITRGAGAYELDDSPRSETSDLEALYLVQRDGAVKVFARGQRVD